MPDLDTYGMPRFATLADYLATLPIREAIERAAGPLPNGRAPYQTPDRLAPGALRAVDRAALIDAITKEIDADKRSSTENAREWARRYFADAPYTVAGTAESAIGQRERQARREQSVR